MKHASLMVTTPYTNNNIFDLSNITLNRDNCLYHYYLLREGLIKNNIDLQTSDLNLPEKSEFIIYTDMPDVLPGVNEMEKSYLIINESQLVKPQNWKLNYHKYFKKIFTWNDKYIDGGKYIKLNTFPVFCSGMNFSTAKKEKLCTIIAGNKSSKADKELYSERVRAIRWFEKNHPEDFDLYGVGWDEYHFSGKVLKHLNRFIFLKKMFVIDYPSYKGKVTEKKTVLSKYKFSICYENAADIPGYITEKICFFLKYQLLVTGNPFRKFIGLSENNIKRFNCK